MKNIEEPLLVKKINSFLQRKETKYPEIKKLSKWNEYINIPHDK